MDLFRVFHWDGHSVGRTGASPFYVPRRHQGSGRHDAPDLFGAWYCATRPASAVAERIQQLRGQTLVDADFQRLGNLTLALAGFRLDPRTSLVDLDDPGVLVARRWRPSQVATRRRAVTQQQAREIFNDGAGGIVWWSTLSADWTNVTLFAERVLGNVSLIAPPRPLTTNLPEVRQAAEDLGIRIGD